MKHAPERTIDFRNGLLYLNVFVKFIPVIFVTVFKYKMYDSIASLSEINTGICKGAPTGYSLEKLGFQMAPQGGLTLSPIVSLYEVVSTPSRTLTQYSKDLYIYLFMKMA